MKAIVINCNKVIIPVGVFKGYTGFISKINNKYFKVEYTERKFFEIGSSQLKAKDEALRDRIMKNYQRHLEGKEMKHSTALPQTEQNFNGYDVNNSMLVTDQNGKEGYYGFKQVVKNVSKGELAHLKMTNTNPKVLYTHPTTYDITLDSNGKTIRELGIIKNGKVVSTVPITKKHLFFQDAELKDGSIVSIDNVEIHDITGEYFITGFVKRRGEINDHTEYINKDDIKSLCAKILPKKDNKAVFNLEAENESEAEETGIEEVETKSESEESEENESESEENETEHQSGFKDKDRLNIETELTEEEKEIFFVIKSILKSANLNITDFTTLKTIIEVTIRTKKAIGFKHKMAVTGNDIKFIVLAVIIKYAGSAGVYDSVLNYNGTVFDYFFSKLSARFVNNKDMQTSVFQIEIPKNSSNKSRLFLLGVIKEIEQIIGEIPYASMIREKELVPVSSGNKRKYTDLINKRVIGITEIINNEIHGIKTDFTDTKAINWKPYTDILNKTKNDIQEEINKRTGNSGISKTVSNLFIAKQNQTPDTSQVLDLTTKALIDILKVIEDLPKIIQMLPTNSLVYLISKGILDKLYYQIQSNPRRASSSVIKRDEVELAQDLKKTKLQ